MSTVNYYLNYIKYFVLGFDIRTNYLQAIAVSVLLFLLVLTLASVRKHFVHWSMKGGLMDGLDSLLSTVQMPGGMPVATVAVGKAGATNAAYLAIQIMALFDDGLAKKLLKDKEKKAKTVEEDSKTIEKRI